MLSVFISILTRRYLPVLVVVTVSVFAVAVVVSVNVVVLVAVDVTGAGVTVEVGVTVALVVFVRGIEIVRVDENTGLTDFVPTFVRQSSWV